MLFEFHFHQYGFSGYLRIPQAFIKNQHSVIVIWDFLSLNRDTLFLSSVIRSTNYIKEILFKFSLHINSYQFRSLDLNIQSNARLGTIKANLPLAANHLQWL